MVPYERLDVFIAASWRVTAASMQASTAAFNSRVPGVPGRLELIMHDTN